MFDIWSLLFLILGIALGNDKSRAIIFTWFWKYINQGKEKIDKNRNNRE